VCHLPKPHLKQLIEQIKQEVYNNPAKYPNGMQRLVVLPE
jgi:hypothetical protein